VPVPVALSILIIYINIDYTRYKTGPHLRGRAAPGSRSAEGERIDLDAGRARLSGWETSVFPDELYQAPRSWAERAYPGNLIHHNRLDRGGHSAAWEQPDLFAGEMRASFRSLR
jgi:pimeloyl-ACP methyl ester carboxylesterase